MGNSQYVLLVYYDSSNANHNHKQYQYQYQQQFMFHRFRLETTAVIAAAMTNKANPNGTGVVVLALTNSTLVGKQLGIQTCVPVGIAVRVTGMDVVVAIGVFVTGAG